jgi:hypothetical protein
MFSYANYPGAFHQETVPLRSSLLLESNIPRKARNPAASPSNKKYYLVNLFINLIWSGVTQFQMSYHFLYTRMELNYISPSNKKTIVLFSYSLFSMKIPYTHFIYGEIGLGI